MNAGDEICNEEADRVEELVKARQAGLPLAYILKAAKRHFMNENLTIEDVDVSIEHIHTACVGYDQYVSSDYTNFFVITLVKHD